MLPEKKRRLRVLRLERPDQSHGLEMEFLVVSEAALKAIRASKSGFA
jgi:hypothetical protein